MQVALREASNDPHDRGEAVLDSSHRVKRRNHMSAFSSSVNLCVGTLGRLRPMQKLAITCVVAEAASSAIAATASVEVPNTFRLSRVIDLSFRMSAKTGARLP